MVPWGDKFDMTISLCFTGNADRVPSLDRELHRVGLPTGLRIWNVPSPHELRIVEALPLKRRWMLSSAGFRNSGFGHYRAVKTAYELGSKRCLVVEDDIRFLKDLDALAETVRTAPDADVLLFDLLKRGSENTADIRRTCETNASGRWTAPGDNPCSMACYGLNRKAMAFLVGCFEGAFDGRWPLGIADHYFWKRWHGGQIRFACAWPLACIQVPVGVMSNTAVTFGGSDPNCQLDWYRELGMDLSAYRFDGPSALAPSR